MVVKPNEKRYLTLDEVRLLLSVITNPAHLIVTRLLLCGMRVSEVVGLKYYEAPRIRRYGKERYDGIRVENIDFAENYVTIKGKGMKERIAVIDRKTMGLLKTYLTLKNIKTGKIFKMSPRNVEDFLKRWEKKAGLRHIHPHRLRHTWSVKALRAGVIDKNVADQLGHSKPEFTKKYYGRIAPDDRRDDIERLMGEEW